MSGVSQELYEAAEAATKDVQVTAADMASFGVQGVPAVDQQTPTIVNGEEKTYGAPLTKPQVGEAPVGVEHLNTPAFYVAKDGTGDWYAHQ